MERGGQPGNKNPVKNRRWREAIARAVARAAAGDLEAGLDHAAEKLVKLAFEGDKWALEELGNRLDGRAPQSIDTTIDAGSGLLSILAGIGTRNDP